jgi:FMN phosphatase YigB (HAD superfamily)
MSDQLTELYNKINDLNAEIPAQQAEMIFLYGQALQRIGFYQADAVNDYKRKYAERKKVWGQAILDTEGTSKDKEANAEVESYFARLDEGKAEAEMMKWKNLYTSTIEVINTLKVKHKTMMDEYNDKAG